MTKYPEVISTKLLLLQKHIWFLFHRFIYSVVIHYGLKLDGPQTSADTVHACVWWTLGVPLSLPRGTLSFPVLVFLAEPSQAHCF